MPLVAHTSELRLDWQPFSIALAAVVAVLMAACGGAGSKSEDAAAVSAMPVRALGATGAADTAAGGSAVQGESVYTEAGKLIRGDETLVALGSEMFGDRVDLYSGGLEFVQNDVSVPGNSALPVAVARRHTAPVNLGAGGVGTVTAGHFGDWELEIPRLQGVFADISTSWSVGGWSGDQALQRCSRFGPPPVVNGFGAQIGGGTFNPDEYWHGSALYVPGGGTQEILIRNPATAAPSDGNYPLTTRNRWALRCLPALANGAGEGFVAVAPDGTRYRFDWMVTRPYAALIKPDPLPQARTGDPTGTGKVADPVPPGVFAGGYQLKRKEVWILPTQVTDRFGNTVTYSYSSSNPWQLLSIQGSDAQGSPRTLNFSYDGSSNRITQVTWGSRAWRYSYRSTPGGYVLASATLPDNSAWTFILDGLTYGAELTLAGATTCDGWNELNVTPRSGSMTSPSGATGSFVVKATRHGRSDVPYECRGDDGQGHGTVGYPIYTDRFSINSKAIAGPGLPAGKTWAYAYGPANASFSPCNGCATTKTVTVTGPEGSVVRYTFGNRFRQTEGQLQLTEEGSASSPGLRTTVRQYRSPSAGPYPDPVGYSTQKRGNGELAARQAPENYKAVVQQGVVFTTRVNDFDTGARPVSTARYSTLGYEHTELTAYHDNTSLWVLGQVASVQDADNGLVMEATSFSSDTALPSARFSFGRKLSTYSYWADGTLKTRGDSLDQVTSFSNYMRGLAQNVTYADGSTEVASVDGYGSVNAVRNPANGVTRYSYDSLGRVSQIAPPEGNPTNLIYEQVGFTEVDLAPGHWRQTVSTGNARIVRLFDAQWRTLMTRTWDSANEAGTRRVTQQRFDREGRKIFDSYPQRDSTSVFADVPGTSTTYDALGRVTLESRTSELGLLNTRTNHLGNFQRQIVNPRGQQLVESFRALDNPAEVSLRRADLPEGVTLEIVPDHYGKALSITRSGQGKSLTRRYVYDASQRLCKSIEPESGATVQTYHGDSTQVAWRASGQNLGNAGSCDAGSVPSVARVSHSYDARNRLKLTAYGDGSPDIARNYTADGLLSQIVSADYTWNYAYDGRRLLKQEQLAWTGGSWTFNWTLDGNGKIAALSDPWGTMNYAPNALGEPTQVSGYASGISYYPSGTVAGYTLANGVARRVDLNARQLPELWRETGPSGTVQQDTYRYDENGNVTSITDGVDAAHSRSMPYYDGLDRLRQANGIWGSGRFDYDALDNLVSSTVGGRSLVHNINPGTNRLDSLSGSQYVPMAYDANGNVVSRNGQAFVFDIGNHLRAAPGKASYSYDGHGRRTYTAHADGNARIQAYTRDGKLRFDYARTGGGTRHVYLGQQLIAETTEGGSTSYIHTDVLGSPVARTNGSGAVISRTRYEPYGVTAAGTNPTGIGFTGHVNDADTGLVYMQQRYYDPIAGRFLSVDPVVTDWESGSSFNRYVYAQNNPYKYVDPDGRFGVIAFLATPPGLAIAAVAVVGHYVLPGREVREQSLASILQAAQPKADGEGSTPEEIANSSGGDTAGQRVTGSDRDKILGEQQNSDGSWTCWRCGSKLWDRSKVDIGHKNVPRSKDGNKHPDNLKCEGQSCNRSSGNRGKPKEGSDCESKSNCGKPSEEKEPPKPEPK